MRDYVRLYVAVGVIYGRARVFLKRLFIKGLRSVIYTWINIELHHITYIVLEFDFWAWIWAICFFIANKKIAFCESTVYNVYTICVLYILYCIYTYVYRDSTIRNLLSGKEKKNSNDSNIQGVINVSINLDSSLAADDVHRHIKNNRRLNHFSWPQRWCA